MDEITLEAEPRTEVGKRARFLRHAGITPANLHIPGGESQTIQASTHELRRVIRAAGHTSIVNLKIAGERRSRPVLIREVTHHPVQDVLLHVDLQQADLRQPMSAEVPLAFVGESEAVKRGGVLLTPVTHLTVEALPAELPSEIAVDISSLAHDDDALHLKDVLLPAGVRALGDEELLVVKVQASKLQAEVAAEEAEAAAAIAEAAPEAAGAASEQPAAEGSEEAAGE
jgi:large subunit ribosomal protein L25